MEIRKAIKYAKDISKVYHVKIAVMYKDGDYDISVGQQAIEESIENGYRISSLYALGKQIWS